LDEGNKQELEGLEVANILENERESNKYIWARISKKLGDVEQLKYGIYIGTKLT
jgi:hypothetical protein